MHELQPQIAELLRTCIQPASLVLRVAHVEFIDVKSNQTERDNVVSNSTSQAFEVAHRYATKLVLTDGQLMIQALLHRRLITLRDAAEVKCGDSLDIKHFQMKKSARKNGRGCVVYLAIEDCHFLKQNLLIEVEEANSTSSRKRARVYFASSTDDTASPSPVLQQADEGDFAGGLLRESSSKRTKIANDYSRSPTSDKDNSGEESARFIGTPGLFDRRRLLDTRASTSTEPPPSQTATGKLESEVQSAMADTIDSASTRNRPSVPFSARRLSQDESEEEEAGFFEAAKVSQKLIAQRRRALQDLDHNTSNPARPSSPNGATNMPTDNIGETVAEAASDRLASAKGRIKEINEALQPQERPLKQQEMQPAKPVRCPEGTFALSQINDIRPMHYPRYPTLPVEHQPTRTEPEPPTQSLLHPPPPFHTLRSLRNPPLGQPLPSKSYTLTTLAFITWAGTTLIHRPGSPFPPKRHLKIVDPSLSASRPPSRDSPTSQQQLSSRIIAPSFQSQNSFQEAVTVAVYIDAADIKPTAGTLALLRGVVMQRLTNGDVILNAYGRLKEMKFDDGTASVSAVKSASDAAEGRNEQHQGKYSMDRPWFITDHNKIRALGHGSKLDYYLNWWKERKV